MTTIARHPQKDGGGKTMPYLRHRQVWQRQVLECLGALRRRDECIRLWS